MYYAWYVTACTNHGIIIILLFINNLIMTCTTRNLKRDCPPYQASGSTSDGSHRDRGEMEYIFSVNDVHVSVATSVFIAESAT